MTSHVPLYVDAGRRKGVTLLEVLIAGGILAVGLAGAAAILPAAGLILGEASSADRAAALANNAFAELSRLGTFRVGSFTAPSPGKLTTIVVGNMFIEPTLTPARTPYPFPVSASVTATSTMARMPSLTPTTADQAAYGNVWFGATATPLQSTRPLRPGAAARVTVIVTQSAAPERDRVGLLAVPGVAGVYEIDPSAGAASPPTLFPPQASPILRDDIRKRLLTGCAWVAVVDEAAGTVRWLRVANSWATYQADMVTIKKCYVSFTDPTMTTTPLTVYAFQGIIRVEERIMQLAE
jgi:type II secretory pathway pseudopilin PulG